MTKSDKARPGIHLVNSALDEVATKTGNQIVLRGVIDQSCLSMLRVDDYQREPLPLASLTKMWQAIIKGESLPDIELGMRSEDFDSSKSEFWLPSDKVYIIDGQQRRNAALHAISLHPDLQVRVGAMIHFGTTKTWERERFRILNLERTKVSGNVLLRNMRHTSPAVLTLYGLSTATPMFPLYERVCWKQSQGANELISARTLVLVSGILHAHRSMAFRNQLNELVPALDRQAALIKLENWRNNISTFFEMIDECFGLRKIAIRDTAQHIRGGFLIQLALVISDHSNFWSDDKQTILRIDPEWRRRIASFPIHDPTVIQLTSSAGNSFKGTMQSMLYSFLRDHLTKGRSANRLINRREQRDASALPRFSDFDPSQLGSIQDDAEYPTA